MTVVGVAVKKNVTWVASVDLTVESTTGQAHAELKLAALMRSRATEIEKDVDRRQSVMAP